MSLTNSRFPPVEETIHGALVRDPYRWLEDRTLPETEHWIQEQQRHCDTYFDQCEDLSAIRQRVREYLDTDIVDQPAQVGQFCFFRRRAHGQEQGCIYVRDEESGAERLLVDPSTEGCFVSVGIHRISADGSLLAFERKRGGEDKMTIHVINVQTGEPLAAKTERGYARGFFFAADNKGSYYCHERPSCAEDHTIRLLRFSDPSADRILFRARRSRGSRLVLTADSVHLGAILIRDVDGQMLEDLWIANQSDPLVWRQVFAKRPLPFSPLLKDGKIFAVSYGGSANGVLVELNPTGEERRTIVPDQGSIIRQVAMRGNCVFVLLFDGLGFSALRKSVDSEELLQIDVPCEGTIRFLSDLGDQESLFLGQESFTQPPSILKYSASSNLLEQWYARRSSSVIGPVAVERTTYSSSDGTTIPMTLIGRNLPLGGHCPAPTVITSYGGFGVLTTPQFSVLVLLLVECGTVVALPHIRGGGEFGKAWHEAGRRRERQASINDFLAAADWLRREGIASSDLGIFGGSHSGLLVAAAMTQRPDLFRAVLCLAPLTDMVRYDSFEQAIRWKEEYGSCENADDFHALYEYSPYHRVRDDTEYPAVLFVTGDKDERCDPAHTRKMAARLMERPLQNNPILVDYSPERGHSPVMPLQVRIDSLARRIAFFCRELNLFFEHGAVHETTNL